MSLHLLLNQGRDREVASQKYSAMNWVVRDRRED